MQAPGCQLSAAAYLLVLLTTSQVLASGKSLYSLYIHCTTSLHGNGHTSATLVVYNIIISLILTNYRRYLIVIKCSRVVLHIKRDYRCQSFRGCIFSSVPIIILSSKRLNLNFSLIASFHLLALLSWIDFFIRSGTK